MGLEILSLQADALTMTANNVLELKVSPNSRDEVLLAILQKREIVNKEIQNIVRKKWE